MLLADPAGALRPELESAEWLAKLEEAKKEEERKAEELLNESSGSQDDPNKSLTKYSLNSSFESIPEVSSEMAFSDPSDTGLSPPKAGRQLL